MKRMKIGLTPQQVQLSSHHKDIRSLEGYAIPDSMALATCSLAMAALNHNPIPSTQNLLPPPISTYNAQHAQALILPPPTSFQLAGNINPFIPPSRSLASLHGLQDNRSLFQTTETTFPTPHLQLINEYTTAFDEDELLQSAITNQDSPYRDNDPQNRNEEALEKSTKCLFKVLYDFNLR